MANEHKNEGKKVLAYKNKKVKGISKAELWKSHLMEMQENLDSLSEYIHCKKNKPIDRAWLFSEQKDLVQHRDEANAHWLQAETKADVDNAMAEGLLKLPRVSKYTFKFLDRQTRSIKELSKEEASLDAVIGVLTEEIERRKMVKCPS